MERAAAEGGRPVVAVGLREGDQTIALGQRCCATQGVGGALRHNGSRVVHREGVLADRRGVVQIQLAGPDRNRRVAEGAGDGQIAAVHGGGASVGVVAREGHRAAAGDRQRLGSSGAAAVCHGPRDHHIAGARDRLRARRRPTVYQSDTPEAQGVACPVHGEGVVGITAISPDPAECQGLAGAVECDGARGKGAGHRARAKVQVVRAARGKVGADGNRIGVGVDDTRHRAINRAAVDAKRAGCHAQRIVVVNHEIAGRQSHAARAGVAAGKNQRAGRRVHSRETVVGVVAREGHRAAARDRQRLGSSGAAAVCHGSRDLHIAGARDRLRARRRTSVYQGDTPEVQGVAWTVHGEGIISITAISPDPAERQGLAGAVEGDGARGKAAGHRTRAKVQVVRAAKGKITVDIDRVGVGIADARDCAIDGSRCDAERAGCRAQRTVVVNHQSASR